MTEERRMSSKAHTQIRPIRTSSVAAIAQGSTDIHADTSDTGKIRSSRRVWKRRQHRDTSDTDKFRSTRRARKRRYTRRHEQYGQVSITVAAGRKHRYAGTHTHAQLACIHAQHLYRRIDAHAQTARAVHSQHALSLPTAVGSSPQGLSCIPATA